MREKKHKILEPIKIGNLQLRNRMVMPAMVTGFAGADWAVTDRLLAYHAARAKNGIGMIIVESCSVDPSGAGPAPHLGIFSDVFIAGLSTLAETIKAWGAKAALQLGHVGRQTAYLDGYKPPVAPSAIMCGHLAKNPKALMPIELSLEEIKKLVIKYGDAAERAKQAGFDLVEIHGAHGYLINQFMSPYTNKRQDEYGGSFENRIRFALEILQEVRGRVGEAYPLSFRISGMEFIDGGLTVEDTKKIAERLQEAGVNVIHVSGAIHESVTNKEGKMFIVPPMCVTKGCFANLAEEIKKAVDIPVIAVGRINDPATAARILDDGQADLVSIGRGMLADPEFPQKVIDGRMDEIRQCIACNACITRMSGKLTVGCSVNAELGKEATYKINKANKKQKVLIIGGGPAGMEAARIAAKRGHEVVIYEKSDQLGGALNIACKPPAKKEIKSLGQYLISEVKKEKIAVHLNAKATPAIVQKEKPDVVLIACGAKPLLPPIPGIDKSNVYTAVDVLQHDIEDLKKASAVAIIGGGMIGCEVAEYILEHATEPINIKLFEQLDRVAIDANPIEREFLIQRLSNKNIDVMCNAKVTAINENSIEWKNKAGGLDSTAIDAVIVAAGFEADAEVEDSLKGYDAEIYSIGDGVSPRKIYNAIHEGAFAARRI